MINKFEEAKNKLVLKAANYAAQYLLSKYGSAHLSGEPKVELSSTEGPVANSYVFSGKISVQAGVEHGQGFSTLDVNMTVNENDIEVTSEDIPANITNALNAAADHTETVVASLDSFNLVDNGSKYLQVSHSALQDASLGIVGKNEYATSPNKSELLQSIVKDAMLETPVTFTGEFKEPVIVKQAAGCDQCDASMINGVFCHETGCPNSRKKHEEEDLEAESSIQPKASWITADLDKMARGPFFEDLSPEKQQEIMDAVSSHLAEEGLQGQELFEAVDDFINVHNDGDSLAAISQGNWRELEASNIGIKEDMPMARMSDSMSQMSQAEAQVVASAKDKIVTEAVNSLVAMLHNMGYGTAKIAEVTDSKDGLDIMTAIDDSGAVKAVSIPVAIKESRVVLPKKSLIATLISKGLDIRAKLSEQFDLEVLEKMAAAEEKAAYDAREAEAILSERPVTKEASGSTNEMFLGETDVLEVQKHLLPGHEDMKKGDKISDGADQWELVDTESNQNDKNEGSASIWKFKKCAPPKADDKEPETKIKA